MRTSVRVFLTILPAACSLVLSTLVVYMVSVLATGDWKYSELLAPTAVTAVGAVLAAGLAATINRRRAGTRAVLALAGVIALGSAACAAGVYFAVLSNCALFCREQVVARELNASGEWEAVVSRTSCDAPACYCSPISNVFVLRRGKTPGGTGNVFRAETGEQIYLNWNGDVLTISAPGDGRVLRQESSVGGVRIEYRPVVRL